MRITVPYTYVHQPTWIGLRPLGAKFYELAANDVEAYWRYMCDRWGERQGFINVEHDVVVNPLQLDALAECPEPVCSFAECAGCSPSLSLIRFSRDFVRSTPAFWQGIPNRHFRYLDSYCQRSTIVHKHTDPPVVNTRPFGALH